MKTMLEKFKQIHFYLIELDVI